MHIEGKKSERCGSRVVEIKKRIKCCFYQKIKIMEEERMCKLKSVIILKDRIFCPDNYDSHTKMLEELKIEDTQRNATNLFVRAELYPKNNDIFTNVEDWVFNVDQDEVPEWFV